MKIYLVTLLLLSGCATQAENQYQTAKIQCDAQYSYQAPTMTQNVRCKNAAAESTIARYYPYPDLLQTALQSRLVYAEEADSGQITTDQAKLEIDELISAATQQALNRANVDQQNALAQDQINIENNANAQKMFQGMAGPNTRPLQTNCYSYGNQTRCTSQ